MSAPTCPLPTLEEGLLYAAGRSHSVMPAFCDHGNSFVLLYADALGHWN
ncbi:MAG: hypothetical protein K6T90_08215 [Leptolyngbyaceae cyanobacterium HOT.MB2.61]|nr:hypothetical protein [Leptolyngbyaceae cyanobacterium HOT.MB2.61]